MAHTDATGLSLRPYFLPSFLVFLISCLIEVILDVVFSELLPKDQTVEVRVNAVTISTHERVKLGHHSFLLPLDRYLFGVYKLQVWLHLLRR
jgi:hypothetical protein